MFGSVCDVYGQVPQRHPGELPWRRQRQLTAPRFLAAENIERVRALNLIAARLEDNLQAVHAPELSADELNEIEAYAVDLGLNLWRRSSES